MGQGHYHTQPTPPVGVFPHQPPINKPQPPQGRMDMSRFMNYKGPAINQNEVTHQQPAVATSEPQITRRKPMDMSRFMNYKRPKTEKKLDEPRIRDFGV